MIDAAEREGGEVKKITDEEIVTNSILFLLAGYETTANTLAYTSYLLALHPEIQEKLQTEIDGYIETKPVSQSLHVQSHDESNITDKTELQLRKFTIENTLIRILLIS